MSAGRQLEAIEAASFPHLDKQARRDVIHRHRNELGQAKGRAAKPATAADLAALGIRVTHVTQDGLPVDGTSGDEKEGQA